MLDTAIGPIIRVIDGNSFQMQVTHVGAHNQYGYNNLEIVFIAPNPNLTNQTVLSYALIGRRVKCHVRYRDAYNRLYGDVFFE
ncbi:MAG: hypothetical protein K0S33_2949 [Bacteroidetes bacterium]|jgi:hypothetical protein|nr:hypothetical protein [Bacteroidota bacterium]